MRILLINQTFYPDSPAVSYFATDLCKALADLHHEVTVIAGNRAYENPKIFYPRYEEYQGIKIHRLSHLSLGKTSKIRRFINFGSFSLNLCIKLLFMPKQDVVIGLTTPPLVAVLGNLFCKFKGGRFLYWVMDLNPDEAIAAGWLDPNSLFARLLSSLSRWSIEASHRIIVLDRFMKKRLCDISGVSSSNIEIVPPWSFDCLKIGSIPHEKNTFRTDQGLQGKFVVMYAGNHSPCHPLKTLLEAAQRCGDNPDIIFYFIGGGSQTSEVTEYKSAYGLKNIRQHSAYPREKLAESLSAADLHVALMGDPFVGILHPCKIYGVLNIGRPFVFIGPEESHMGDLIRQNQLGWQVKHGDVDGLLDVIHKVRLLNAQDKEAIYQKSVVLASHQFSQKRLTEALVRIVESKDL